MCQVDILDLFHKMEEKGLFLCSVESLTGGLFASTIIGIPGASHIYKGSFVTYCNEIKNIIGVQKETLEKYTAISRKTAEEMVINGVKKLNCNVGVSFTGNAGPEPSEGKPVGLIYISIYLKGKIYTYELNIVDERNNVRKKCVEFALEKLYELIG